MLFSLNKRIQKITQSQNYKNYSYLTFEDIKNLSNKNEENNIFNYNNTSALKSNLMNKSNNLFEDNSPFRNSFNFNQRKISLSSVSSKFLKNNV